MASDTAPKTWRDWLSLFQTTASTRGFVDYMRARDHWEGGSPPAAVVAPLYSYIVNARLMTTYLLASTQTPPDQVASALEEVRRAARSVEFDRHPPKSLKQDERELYEPTTKQAASGVKDMANLLFDIFTRYVRDEVEPNATADAIFREACRLSLLRDDKAALRRMADAGVLVLLGSPMWYGWLEEGSKLFSRHAFLLHSAFESCQHALPLLPIAEQRLKADELAGKFEWPATKLPEQQMDQQETDGADPAQVIKLISVAESNTPWTDEEMQAHADERAQLIEHATDILYRAVSLPDSLDAYVQGVAVRVLGILRCDDPKVIEHLISCIVRAEKRGDPMLDPEIIHTIIQALQRIGAPAAPACLRFLRNSFHQEARLDVALALGIAGRGSDEVFQYLLEQFEQASPKDSNKARWAMPLALMHDERAIAPIARALEATRDEPDRLVRTWDAHDYLDALHELGALTAFITPPETSDEDAPEDEREDEAWWTSVEVRGVGLLQGVAPKDWIPPDEDEDDVVEDTEHVIGADDDLDDLFIYEPPSPSAKSTPPALAQPSTNAPKVGRNDPCPCGSGKKYKHCCGRPK